MNGGKACCFPQARLCRARVGLKGVLLWSECSLFRIRRQSLLADVRTGLGHEPSPAVLLPGWAAGICEASRFLCMKFPGVSGVFDYAGPNRNSRYRFTLEASRISTDNTGELAPVDVHRRDFRFRALGNGSRALPIRLEQFHEQLAC